jgi:hypothetical protein
MFAASSMSNATGAIALALEAGGGTGRAAGRLRALAVITGLANAALARSAEQHLKRRGLNAPLEQQPTATVLRVAGLGLGTAVPLGIHAFETLTGRRSRLLSALAPAATLAALARSQVDTLLLTGLFLDDERTAWFGPAPTDVAGDRGALAALGVPTPVEGRLVDVLEDDVDVVEGQHLGDAGAHDAGPEDGDRALARVGAHDRVASARRKNAVFAGRSAIRRTR